MSLHLSAGTAGRWRCPILVAGLLASVWGTCLAAPAGATASGKTKESGAALKVQVELLPGETEKIVDPSLSEKIPVAILGTPDLDVRSLDPASFPVANCPPACTIFQPPTAPFGSSLSVFKGTNQNDWQLFIMDDGTGDVGSLQAWCIEFLPSLTSRFPG